LGVVGLRNELIEKEQYQNLLTGKKRGKREGQWAEMDRRYRREGLSFPALYTKDERKEPATSQGRKERTKTLVGTRGAAAGCIAGRGNIVGTVETRYFSTNHVF